MSSSPPQLEQVHHDTIIAETREHLGSDTKVVDRVKSAKRIQLIVAGLTRHLGMNGEVNMFGSFSNGFKTGGSDLDIVFRGDDPVDSSISLLSRFMEYIQKNPVGFENVTQIFQANVPLVKFTDKVSEMEVDYCINNELGVRNSLLLNRYCVYDDRVLQMGRLVKDWAKRHDLVGTADGCLNSYAYALLNIHYLQFLGVVPNLQELATESVDIVDQKWGCEDVWDTKFFDGDMPPSENKQSVAELLVGFFHYYSNVFDWKKHAVCMRQCGPGKTIDKETLRTPSTEEQWYVEDPFDLKHNLAGKCSRQGRRRILYQMEETLRILTQKGSWKEACPSFPSEVYFLKCRVSPAVTAHSLMEKFEDVGLVKLHFPKPDGSQRMGQAFLEFDSSVSRRKAHTLNEGYVLDCQLQLHYTSQSAWAEAVNNGTYSTYDMASYKMQRQVMMERQLMLTKGKDGSRDHMKDRPDAQMMQENMMMGMPMPPYHPGYPFYGMLPTRPPMSWMGGDGWEAWHHPKGGGKGDMGDHTRKGMDGKGHGKQREQQERVPAKSKGAKGPQGGVAKTVVLELPLQLGDLPKPFLPAEIEGQLKDLLAKYPRRKSDTTKKEHSGQIQIQLIGDGINKHGLPMFQPKQKEQMQELLQYFQAQKRRDHKEKSKSTGPLQ